MQDTGVFQELKTQIYGNTGVTVFYDPRNDRIMAEINHKPGGPYVAVFNGQMMGMYISERAAEAAIRAAWLSINSTPAESGATQ